ncbi:hypothetical protein ACHQM5_015056 [Ranunculus cassubicifolius]
MVKKRCCGRIPNDLLLEILSRLPIKSLCRFKSVSKSWQSEIQSQFLINKTRPKAPFKWQIQDNRNLDYYSIGEDGNATLIHRYEHDDNINSVFNCKDLVSVFVYGSKPQLKVINLATQEFVQMPYGDEHCFRFGSSEYVGIGFDPSCQKYKLYRTNSYGLISFQVFALENNPSWKNVHMQRSPSGKPIIYFDGSLYWNYSSMKLLSLSFITEEFSFIDLPADLPSYTSQCELFEFNKSLCLVHWRKKTWDSVEIIGMWMLKDDHGWVSMMKNITLSLEGIDFIVGCQFFGRNSEILIVVSGSLVAERYVYEYNILSGKFKKIKVTGLPIWNRYSKERIV